MSWEYKEGVCSPCLPSLPSLPNCHCSTSGMQELWVQVNHGVRLAVEDQWLFLPFFPLIPHAGIQPNSPTGCSVVIPKPVQLKSSCGAGDESFAVAQSFSTYLGLQGPAAQPSLVPRELQMALRLFLHLHPAMGAGESLALVTNPAALLWPHILLLIFWPSRVILLQKRAFTPRYKSDTVQGIYAHGFVYGHQ